MLPISALPVKMSNSNPQASVHVFSAQPNSVFLAIKLKSVRYMTMLTVTQLLTTKEQTRQVLSAMNAQLLTVISALTTTFVNNVQHFQENSQPLSEMLVLNAQLSVKAVQLMISVMFVKLKDKNQTQLEILVSTVQPNSVMLAVLMENARSMLMMNVDLEKE